ncbi:MAG: branched-chain amino acid ABC transporter permease, partial [Thermotogaceae bacterium]|nr:branched-chain amino acid ABC transporter permease [Thermotogaceae bacterium]
LLILIITGVVLLSLYLLMNYTKLGKAMKACADDIEMAAAMGINVEYVISFAFFLGSVLAALAGILIGVYENNVYPTMGDEVSYKAFVVIVLGGFGSLTGAITAGFLLAFAETLLVAWKGFVLPRDAIAFLLMILILIFKPEGLFRRVTR